MPLKLKREDLERIVYEELTRYVAEQLTEAPHAGTVLDDEDELPPDPEQAPEEQMPDDSPAPEAGDPSEEEPPELPTGEEPADDELEADAAGEEESQAEPGSVAAELEGKTIESISLEEDSKIMPGSLEVVVTFRENPDALRLLVTKTGKLKIFYKGLHNDFGSPVEQIPGEDEEDMDLGGEEEPGDEIDTDVGGEEEPLEDVPPLGDEDIPPEEEPEA